MSLVVTSDDPYRQAGVDLKRADAVVGIAKTAAAKTLSKGILSTIGGFSGAFELPEGMRQPVMLSACDGVGTKLKLAFLLNKHDTVGIDLVAMSVNDILVNAGTPLAFLDYMASSTIDTDILASVLAGVAEGCVQAGCALLGGETAEMPGFYEAGEYDLAGFCVGVVEKQALTPHRDRPVLVGDVLIGLASSGLHSNGFSLVRKVLLTDHAIDLNHTPTGFTAPLGETLLTPTRIYVKPVLALLKAMPNVVSAMVHVTGGGFTDNVPRILPHGLGVHINPTAWERPSIYAYLQQLGRLSDEAMLHTFNCGIGYILVVPPSQVVAVTAFLNNHSPCLAPVVLGHVVSPQANEATVAFV
jgi:phosphoribosylformylglycinamidine cyclo-ligase